MLNFAANCFACHLNGWGLSAVTSREAPEEVSNALLRFRSVTLAMNSFSSFFVLIVVGSAHCYSQPCSPQQYDTCTNRFLERDFIILEEFIKSYPVARRMTLDAAEIGLLCSGFRELLDCFIAQYSNCDAPLVENAKIIQASVSVSNLLCSPTDRSLIQLAVSNAHCYLDADARCRSFNITMLTWKEILRFERVLTRQATCNALIDHGRCLLAEYNSSRCSTSQGRDVLEKTIRAWGGTYCSKAQDALQKSLEHFALLLFLLTVSFCSTR